MGDVNRRRSLRAKIAKPAHQAIALIGCKGRCWFVQNEQPGLLGECSNDLDDLLHSDAEPSDRHRRIEIRESKTRKQLPCIGL